MTARFSIMLAAISGFLTVALGAFAAHGLRSVLSEYAYDIWQTAVQYQMFHSLALLAVGLLLIRDNSAGLRWAAWLYIGGMLLFCGSLYLLACTGIKVLGAITPIGGSLFLLAWLLLAISAFNRLKNI